MFSPELMTWTLMSRYDIRVGRSKHVRGPFIDRSGRKLLHGGGTIVYASNHGVVYAPGGLGVLTESGNRSDILYYHYRGRAPRWVLGLADLVVNTTIGFTNGVSRTGDFGLS